MIARTGYGEAVGAQPERLSESARQLYRQLAELDPSEWRQKTLGLVGMGASTHAGHMLAWIAGRRGVRARNIDASALISDHAMHDPADAYIVTSESGESAETVKAAERIRKPGVLGLTNAIDSSLARTVDAKLDMSCGTDSPVYTIGYTATLQAFALLADWLHIGGPDTDTRRLAPHAENVLKTTESKAQGIGYDMAAVRMVDVVGHGPHYAAAAETALLLREACRMPSSAYDTYQYLHGPMECLDDNMACIMFGSDRELPLSAYTAARGIDTLLITEKSIQEGCKLRAIQIPSPSVATRSVLEILPAQHLVGAIADFKGLVIDGFRYHQEDTKLFQNY